VVIDLDDTTIFGGGGSREQIDGRIAVIKKTLAGSNSEWDKGKLEERLAKLAGGVAVIKVGAPTELAMNEKRARIEDALSATRAAVAEGLVPGGGVAYVRCIDALDGLKLGDARRYGVDIVRRALEEPLRQIARNAGADPSVVVKRVRDGGDGTGAGFGFNAETDAFEDLVAAGVVDPAKVVRSALQNAASVAGLLLTTEAIMAEPEKPEFKRGAYPQTPYRDPSRPMRDELAEERDEMDREGHP
jgi:chaperonin GroEL